MKNWDMKELAWDRVGGLIPAIIQQATTGDILMLGYMNLEALDKTLETKEVTFYSRSKNRLWIKGEMSGNKLRLLDIFPDCDEDALLLSVEPMGPTCHKGFNSCFGDQSKNNLSFLSTLTTLITQRHRDRPSDSYVSQLFNADIKRIAQKVGEEGVEVALASLNEDNGELCEEAADLLFHLLVLLEAKQISIYDVLEVLRKRANKTESFA